ncbi:Abi family protein [Cellulomonas sp.]|uniref:Abi family protein n=1 Tax=Cellulomonas sp. TaxID=40001 RepID=UPI002D2A9473|nr:Abi family protein [Cellulomonas sp.]HYQ73783.1 Abi family protein [Cellulomonas sp.]
MSTPTWVDDWLTPERFRKYREAAGGDVGLALALYDWNAELASAFLRDLGHLEVGLRNAYDRALLRLPEVGSDWIDASGAFAAFPPHWAVDRRGVRRDKNATPRSSIRSARVRSGYTEGVVPRGKVVAELGLGFWTYLTDDMHEKQLWVRTLRTAYVAGADRAKLHRALSALREVRNRVAHHESIFDRAPESQRRYLVYVARHLSADLRDHIVRTSRLPELLAHRPSS